MKTKIFWLRVFHGLASLYFGLCLLYLYLAAIVGRFDPWLTLAVVSLGLEGFGVFVLNNGDCPLIHIQRRFGDEKPFFELFMSPRGAKRVLPVFAVFTWIALGLLVVRFGLSLYY